MTRNAALGTAAVAAVLTILALSQAPLLANGGTAPALTSPAAEQAAQEIDEETLRGPIRFLSHDLLEGRGPASRGDQLTQEYLAATLEQMGLAPGGENGSYLQRFDIVGITGEVPETWSFRKGEQTLDLKRWDQFIAASGVQEPAARIDGAEVVFVGYGIQAPEYQWDDFKGADLKGKVLLMLNNDPDWDPQLFEGTRRLYYGRWTYKYESAARQGAAGAIIVHTTPSAGYPWQVVQTSWSGEQFELPAEGEPRVQVAAWATEEAAGQLARLGGQDLAALVEKARSRDFRPVPLGVTTSLTFPNKISRVQTANVGGLLRGGDPALAGEVVVYSAHHDHLGIGEPDKEGDRIYNGALDNAAGTAQVLAIAKAFTALPEPPRRSVLFLFVAAEEQGLLGSEYYAKHPTFPPGKIAANINYDGGNIWGRATEVAFIGYGKSDLDQVVERYAARQDRKVVGDQFPDRGFYYRSDQFNFAKVGVPAVYLDTGTKFRGKPDEWGKQQIEAWEAVQYHQPSDELTAEWTFDGMAEDARLGFFVGLDVAQGDRLPAWKPGDEFEAARQAALANAGR
ncbi:MAG TPA: M28 family peptidase [Thermoanaerobaculia bacterium]|nr:M28 family peptidase [Thermoanaerobaculia bacterium]